VWQKTIHDIRQTLTGPLPGRVGQSQMAPEPLPGQVNRWEPVTGCREAGVLLLLYPHDTGGGSELHIVLIRRPEYSGVHSGQISLPGGRREGRESLQETALRETREEIGVKPDTVEMLGQLSLLYTPVSNFCIYPFVAFSLTRPAFQPDPGEVAGLLEPPLSWLLNPAARRAEQWNFPQGARRVPFFDVFGLKVWGATAMILSEFLMTVRGVRHV
jgi:8-oxo-dGTP pyrophosphatase MutT (NUDIX family)